VRTCASCGKANNPIRKYCVRCGKSLLTSKVDISVKTSSPTTNEPEIEIKRPQPVAEEAPKPASGTPTVTSGDQWVKPSEITRDRMRTASSSRGKSEMEKAKEAFARAEQVGIQEEGGDIVETRMLRASEVRELMQDLPAQTQTPQQPIEKPLSPSIQKPMNVTHESLPTVTPKVPPMQNFVDIERSSSTPTTTNSSPPPIIKPQASTIAPQKVRLAEKKQPTTMEERPHSPSEILVAPKPSNTAPTTSSSLSAARETPVQEMDEIMSCITHPEDLQDGKIKEFVNELASLRREIQEVTANQIAIGSQLDTRVRESQNKSEVKRIHYESISEQMRLAKQEWDDAKEEYEKSENRRKKELSTLEDKIKSIQKRIDKAEGGVRKRVGELNKVREKIAQLQQQDSS
jgi:hypothetical protein